jgi:integrase/recombinase XerD
MARRTEKTEVAGAEPRHRPFLVERFHDFLALERGSANRTQEAYGRDVIRFVDFALSKGATSPTDVASKTLRDYVYHLKDLGLSPSSIRRNVSAVRGYFKFLVGDGLVVRDPTERIETPKRWRTLPEVLTVAEIQKLLAAPTMDDPLYFRDRAMLEVAYGAGLRVSEWIGIGLKDALLDDGLVRVFGKGSKERLVPIGRSAIGALAIYMRELRPELEKGSGSIPTRCGTRSQRICWRVEPISARCRKCLGMPTFPPRRSTRTWTASTCGRCTGAIIRGHDPRHR